jgi:hypothetical protein
MQTPIFRHLLALLFFTALRAAPIELNWLDGAAPAAGAGVSWGVPWPKGAMPRDQAFTLTAADGARLPLQSWPLAYWPDGSLKWSGFATVAGSAVGRVQLNTSSPADAKTALATRVIIRESETAIDVDTGALRARVLRWGGNLVDSLVVGGREVARDGRLVCLVDDAAEATGAGVPHREAFQGKLERVTIEQRGPVRAVLKLEGVHRALRGSRTWLPFVVRLYFFAGSEQVRMVHTITFDGDEQQDFIRGLGLEFRVPLREELQNRHVRFAGGEGGLWAEPVQPMVGRGGRAVRDPQSGSDVYPDQLQGKRIPNAAAYNAQGQSLLADWAYWDAFRLTQPNADGFSIVKRTNAQSAWIPCGAGQQASGYAFIGDASGGLGVSLKNFWQSHPTSLEITGASTAEATLRVWLWTPEAPAMDLRHYDTRAHGLEAVYEDVQPGMSTPHGVARTSELTLFATGAVPTRDSAVAQAKIGAQPPLLVASPQYLHQVKALGVWSLPDKSTPFKRAVEEQLESTLAYYLRQVEVQHWYGFWDFGDVMHSYDAQRHVWNYDLGGMAWDNTELGTDLWLWMSFLRTGRADIFRMAEAMTRHTSEVDCYHLGEFEGLGSRHNVRHWGCGAKEARISMAHLRRFHYYLTTDERTGDLMRAVVNVDQTALKLDPMRLAQPITEAEKKYPARVRVGPDWFAYVGNWATEWERTGDTRWRDKIVAGVDSLLAMPYWLKTGKNLVQGYDPASGKLYQVSDQVGSYNLATIQAGAEVIFDLNTFLDHPGWQRMWLQYCRLGSAPAEVLLRDKDTGNEGADGRYVGEQGAASQGTPRLAAYAYAVTRNPAFAKPAVASLLRFGGGAIATRRVDGALTLTPFDEALRISTNGAAQSGLSVIEILELCADQLPTEVPPPEAFPGRGGRGGRGAAGTGPAVPARPAGN